MIIGIRENTMPGSVVIILWQMGKRAQPLTERKFVLTFRSDALSCALDPLLTAERNWAKILSSICAQFAFTLRSERN